MKVADFSWVAVGPVTMRHLADYGATVVRVESNSRPEALRAAGPYKDNIPGIDRTSFFADFNAGKYGMSLNLNHPKGQEVARRLIAWADVVSESFTAGMMKRWGLNYERAREINPRIIYLSTTQQGQTGPLAAQPGFGTQLVSLAGFTYLIGYPDREPAGTYGAYTDYVNPWFGAAVVAGALEYRKRTGKGLHIDQSQLEGGLQFLAPVVLDYTVNGRVATRKGNRCSKAVPHNAYPCSGEDRWITIAVFNDRQWSGLCEAMGHPSWAKESRFRTMLGRKRNEEELDKLVGEWTSRQEAHGLMQRLQEKGVPAGVVQTAEDMFNDPQLKQRGHFVPLRHSEIGLHSYDSFAFRLSESGGEPGSAAPCLGEHNEKVYKEVLGYSEEEIADLIAEGVID